MVLRDFNIHMEAEVSGPAHEFLETMASLDSTQQFNGSTHMGSHLLDLVFAAKHRECVPMVANLVSPRLSWSDHHLIKCILTVALPSHGELGPIKMVHPQRLLDPVGFQDIMQEILADLVGVPVNALLDSWYTTATRVVNTLTPKHPLC